MNYELIAICDGLKMRSLTSTTSLLRVQVEKFLKKGTSIRKDTKIRCHFHHMKVIKENYIHILILDCKKIVKPGA